MKLFEIMHLIKNAKLTAWKNTSLQMNALWTVAFENNICHSILRTFPILFSTVSFIFHSCNVGNI